MQKKCSFRTRLVGLKHEDKRIFFWPTFMQSDYVWVVDFVVSKNKLSSIQGSNFRNANLCFLCKWAVYMLFFLPSKMFLDFLFGPVLPKIKE